jgi:hypothetical protein
LPQSAGWLTQASRSDKDFTCRERTAAPFGRESALLVDFNMMPHRLADDSGIASEFPAAVRATDASESAASYSL